MYLISLIIKIIFVVLISFSESQRKINEEFRIDIVVEGIGYQVILSEYADTPFKVIINGETQDIINVMYNMKEKINNITLIWNELPSLSKMFKNIDAIISVDLSYFYSYDAIEDTSEMLYGCRNLNYVNFKDFPFSFVENMDKMFYDCVKLTSLDLSSFYSATLYSMESMFENDESLLYLDLSNFDISSVTNMEKMFYNCNSLIYVNFKNLKENEENFKLEDLFSNNTKKLIYCIDEDECPKINSYLLSKGFENNCENICFNKDRKINTKKKTCASNCEEKKYAYEKDGICYEIKDIKTTIPDLKKTDKINKDEVTENETEQFSDETEETKDTIKQTNEITEIKNDITQDHQSEKETNDVTDEFKFSSENFFKESIDKKNEESLNKDKVIESLREEIISGKLDSLFSEIINKTNQDLIAQFKDISYQITSTGNQKSNVYNNISSIDLGDCEENLKTIYNIDQNLSLIILKIDYHIDDLLIPIIGYEVYHPINYSQLNLNYCNNTIKLHIPVEIEEDEVYKYDLNSDYYNDECFAYTTENGTDIILNDRKNEYIEQNLSLCENKCAYDGYNITTKKALCECETKIQINLISEILEEENLLANDVHTSENNNLNIGAMKCISLLFSKHGLIKNLGSYILFLSVLFFGISIIIVYKCGMEFIQRDIDNIIYLKKSNKKIKKNEDDIYNCDKKNNNQKKKNKKKLFPILIKKIRI